jgi:hypothetical protein
VAIKDFGSLSGENEYIKKKLSTKQLQVTLLKT